MKENGTKVHEVDTENSPIPMARGTKEDGVEINGVVRAR